MEKYRTFWPRLVAFLIDGFIMIPLSILEDWFRKGGMPPQFFYVFFPIAAAIPIVYRIFTHGKYGQTLGKMAMYVKVIDVQTERDISFSHALRRELPQVAFSIFAIVVSIIYFGIDPEAPEMKLPMTILGSFAMVWTVANLAVFFSSEKSRTLNDVIAGTVVVKMPKEPAD
jgi:uncharacterized RDD family membrane protein YckC